LFFYTAAATKIAQFSWSYSVQFLAEHGATSVKSEHVKVEDGYDFKTISYLANKYYQNWLLQF